MSGILTALALCLAVASQQSFVDTAPINEGPTAQDSPQDSSVKELESLKHSLGKTLAMMKTQSESYTENNGHSESHAEKTAQVNENGKLFGKVGERFDYESKGTNGQPLARIQTDFDIPSKGIHKSVVQQLAPEYEQTGNGNRRSESSIESSNSVDTSVQYSPLDMAEYVFWTGDEKGVTLAIEEFLQEGLMTREEAISFLQEIKYNLDYLKNHYTQLGLNSREHSHSQEPSFKYPTKTEKSEMQTTFDLDQLRQGVQKRQPETPHLAQALIKSGERSSEDYDELLERLKVADSLYTEYSLEEVIYQLAKVMFTQSLTRGSAEAQQALQKFTNFLEVEAEQGHISRALEKKVLDVLIASLADTLSEHPELIASARDSLGAGSTTTNGQQQQYLRQLLEISPEEKLYKSLQLSDSLKDIKIVNRIPLGLGKYKNP